MTIDIRLKVVKIAMVVEAFFENPFHQITGEEAIRIELINDMGRDWG